MKKLLLSAMALLLTSMTFAQQRSESEMLSIATACFNNIKGSSQAKGAFLQTSTLKLSAMSSDITKTATSSNEAFAVFTPQEGTGFVIVSTDEKMPAVLASSASQNFMLQYNKPALPATACGPLTSMTAKNILAAESYIDTPSQSTSTSKNEALQELLENYVCASELISSGKATVEDIFGTTKNSLTGSSTYKSPLLGDIVWGQGAPFNYLCPVVNDTTTVTGCVATSMAQLMKYYKSPTTGTGSISYYTETRNKYVYKNFANTTFNWSGMLDNYNNYDGRAYSTTNISSLYTTTYMIGSTGFSTDSSYPYCIYINNLYNITSSSISGYVYLVLKNSSGTVKRIVSYSPLSLSLSSGYGYNWIRLVVNFPADIADGTYTLYPVFSTGTTTSASFYAARELISSGTSISLGTGAISTTVTKSGNNFTCCNLTFAATTISDVNVSSVANLMYACGAAAQSDYNTAAVGGTGASAFTAWAAMNTYFGYDADLYYTMKGHATTNQICAAAKEELDNNHVIPVGAHTIEGSGHSYLIDGYDMSDTTPKFHINWGWNGSDNGYYLITQMQPGVGGTGGSTDNYSYFYYFFMNVCPDNSTTDPNGISATKITATSTSLKAGSSTSVTFTEINNNNLINSISGYLYCYLVADDGTAYKTTAYKSILTSNALPAGSYFNTPQTISVTIPSTVPAGTYHFELRKNANDVFFCPSFPNITVTSTSIKGDVTGDGKVTIADVDAVINVIIGKNTNSKADVNNDAKIDVEDINTVIANMK